MAVVDYIIPCREVFRIKPYTEQAIAMARNLHDRRIRRLSPPVVRYKVIHTGNAIYEVYRYSDSKGFCPRSGKRYAVKKKLLSEGETGSDSVVSNHEKRGDNMNRARNDLRRLINANFDSSSYFVTLTFKDNLTDIDLAYTYLKRYLIKLRRKYGDVKYIGVREYQKRGAIHFHLVMNVDLNKDNQLGLIWGHGWVDCRTITSRNKNRPVDNIGAYMIKYLGKDEHKNEAGRKAYICSRGLVRPLVFRGDDSFELIERLQLNAREPVFMNSYSTDYHGVVTYSEYNLDRKTNSQTAEKNA